MGERSRWFSCSIDKKNSTIFSIEINNLKKSLIICINIHSLYFCLPVYTGSRGRVARQWSAKPSTAVRIRPRPHLNL